MKREIISKTEDSIIYYSERVGYYIEDRDDVCVIEEFNIDSKRLSSQAAVDVIDWYKKVSSSDKELLEEILSSVPA